MAWHGMAWHGMAGALRARVEDRVEALGEQRSGHRAVALCDDDGSVVEVPVIRSPRVGDGRVCWRVGAYTRA
jgi:hypothetical protein